MERNYAGKKNLLKTIFGIKFVRRDILSYTEFFNPF